MSMSRDAASQVFLVEQIRALHAHRVGIRHVLVDVGERELHRLDLQVQAVGGIHGDRAKVEVLEYAERHLRRDALPVGRNLVQRVAAVVLGERLDPVDGVRGEVIHRHCAAMRAGMRGHLSASSPR